jgi:outer membrane receptor protein involved in Fe transport
VPDANGKRQLLALAMDWRVSRDTLIEGEFEYSRLRQPSVPGLSLLGNALPPADPFININSQPWSQPNQLDSFTGSVGIQQAINSQWRWQGQLGTQRLKSDDRLAYPFGCYDAGSGAYYADRFCPNGDFDLYDYRSNNERRQTQSALLKVIGDVTTGSVRHNLSFGVQGTRYRKPANPRPTTMRRWAPATFSPARAAAGADVPGPLHHPQGAQHRVLRLRRDPVDASLPDLAGRAPFHPASRERAHRRQPGHRL